MANLGPLVRCSFAQRYSIVAGLLGRRYWPEFKGTEHIVGFRKLDTSANRRNMAKSLRQRIYPRLASPRCPLRCHGLYCSVGSTDRRFLYQSATFLWFANGLRAFLAAPGLPGSRVTWTGAHSERYLAHRNLIVALPASPGQHPLRLAATLRLFGPTAARFGVGDGRQYSWVRKHHLFALRGLRSRAD